MSRVLPVRPVADPAAVVAGDRWRFTVLADGLIRYEWAPDGVFEDRASTFAVTRDLPVPEFRVVRTGDTLEIITDRVHLVHDGGPFSASGLTAQVRGGITVYHSVWRFGQPVRDLGGTARTLDEADGPVPLGPGVVSRNGFAVVDDSRSMLFEPDGWVAPRRPVEPGGGDRVDGYLFAYGLDHRAAVHALYAVSGPQPLLPRHALGNWWSRYHAYTADEYLGLMDRFRAEGAPLSVAVLDMDWHEVDVDPAVGSGWTGYSWNRRLFPDPDAFLDQLHDRGLAVTLNVHPADGIRRHEEAYARLAEALGRDTSTGDPIAFDVTDRAFLDAYFDVLHRRLEEPSPGHTAVDFWWLDWQSGEFSRTAGIDPLWMLNHFHFLDNARDGRRPMTFSRYAGPGSHRYPVGFSGDTVVSWASLAFQPEFTATASNIGYGWWSHDIGGHMFGALDDELAARWVQLGVFSPVLRLHSSNNPFNTKEPWSFGNEARIVMTDALRLRHRLIPYLYTMNARAAVDGDPLVAPVYWDHPDAPEAYRVPAQFAFGSQLVVAPITSPRDPATRLGAVRAWVPPGRHVDVLTGVVYDGDRELDLHRPLGGYPVLAPLGAIVPLDGDAEPRNGGPLPTSLEVLVVVGADGAFELLEDDGTGAAAPDVVWARTPIVLDQAAGTVTIGPATGAVAALPAERELRLRLPAGVPETVRLLVDGVAVGGDDGVDAVDGGEDDGVDGDDGPVVERTAEGTLVRLGRHPVGSRLVVELGADPQPAVTDAAPRVHRIVDAAQVGFELKSRVWAAVTDPAPLAVRLGRLHALDMPPALLDAVLELVLADSRA